MRLKMHSWPVDIMQGVNNGRANDFNAFWNFTREGQRIFNDQDLYINQDAEFKAAGVGINRNDNFHFLAVFHLCSSGNWKLSVSNDPER